jgi:3D (Asp-Asp-Asp) domain-containing protein
MNATAYTSSNGRRTATGMVPEYGIVAVDPRVIPLGTWLYVEGYGHALAADTGRLIKGQTIDLYYHTRQEAILFGRRDIRVYVLAEPMLVVEEAPEHGDLPEEFESTRQEAED